MTSLLTGWLIALSGAGPAGAAGIDVSSIRDLIVDESHGRTFVSGGALATTDLTGAPTGTVAGVSAAKQMVLTPDSTQLVVANADGLAVVDTASATLVRTIPTGPDSCPDAVVPAAGLFFFTYGNCPGGTPGLGAVDLTDDSVTKNIATGSVALAAPKVMLESVAAAPSMIVLLTGETIAVLDATGGDSPAVTVRASKTLTGLEDPIAVNAAGTEVVTGGGTGKHLSAFSTTDLSVVREYSQYHAAAIAIRADGRLALSPGKSYADLSMFTAAGTFLHSLEFVPRTAAVGVAAFGAERAYVATADYSGSTPTFHVLRAPVGPPAVLTLTSNASAYNYKGTATLTIKLASPTHSRTVAFFARTEGRDLRFIKTLEVSASTRTAVVKVPGLVYNTNFLVKFAGDDVYAASSAIRAVKVRAKLVISSASTSVINGYHRLHPSPAPVVTFQVYPNHPHQCVRISGQLLVNGTWRTLAWGMDGCVKTNANSRIGIKLIGFERGDRVRISAVYSNGGLYGEPAPGGAGNIDSPRVEYRILMY